MKKIIFFLLCLYGVTAFAQDCDKEQLKNEPGKWLPQPGDEINPDTMKPAAADAAGAKSVFNKIGKMFQQEYKPVGADVYNYLTYNTVRDSPYGNSYIYTLSNFSFVCINGKRSRNSEAVSTSVHINPGGLLNAKFGEMPLYNDSGEVSSEAENSGGFYALTRRECREGKLPDLSNGYHGFESGYDYQVWITYENKMPFRYVSRKEFLEKQLLIGEAKLKELNKYYSSKDWEELLKMLPENKEKMLETKKTHLGMFEKPLETYRQDLKKDAAWLDEMAVVKQETVSGVFRYVFTTVGDPYMTAVPLCPILIITTANCPNGCRSL